VVVAAARIRKRINERSTCCQHQVINRSMPDSGEQDIPLDVVGYSRVALCFGCRWCAQNNQPLFGAIIHVPPTPVPAGPWKTCVACICHASFRNIRHQEKIQSRPGRALLGLLT